MGKGYCLYNPNLRKFYSIDILSPSNQDGINRYIFVEGDPVNYLDPTGHVKFSF